jgi:hypothetical protein
MAEVARANAAADNAAQQPADCVSESADVPVTPAAAPAVVAPVSIVPPAVELPTNQVMDKDALAKAFGKEMEVRGTARCCLQCLDEPKAGRAAWD